MSVLEQPTTTVTGEIAPGYTVTHHVNRSRRYDVYEVWSAERHCHCAAKIVRGDRLHEEKGHRRLRDEGNLLLGLSHPNILRAYELADGPTPVLITEALPGVTLAHAIEEEGPLDLTALLHIGQHVVSAVAYLHHNNVLHVDLKPGNLVCSFGIVRAIDLSLAQAPGRIRPGVGTHKYLAPEQALGGIVNEATDVWGIGGVLWETAVGRSAFSRIPGDDDRYDQLERRAESVRKHRDLPRALSESIDACLEPDPSHRPTVLELSEVLDALM